MWLCAWQHPMWLCRVQVLWAEQGGARGQERHLVQGVGSWRQGKVALRLACIVNPLFTGIT